MGRFGYYFLWIFYDILDILRVLVDILRYSGYFANFGGYSKLTVFWVSDTQEWKICRIQ